MRLRKNGKEADSLGRTTRSIVVGVVIALVAGAISGGFGAQIVTERRLTRLEATVEMIREDVRDVKLHLLGE
jgi:hypothetical protein